MSHTTAKTTLSIPLYVRYRCSKCGEMNYCVHTVEETWQASQMGVLASKSAREELANRSSGYARAAMGRRMKSIFDEKKSERYESAEFNCKCQKCGNKEPWSKMRYTPIDSVMGFLLVFSLLMCYVSLKIGITYVIALAVWLIIKKLHKNRMNMLIKQLPKSSLPEFSIYQEEIFGNDYVHVEND